MAASFPPPPLTHEISLGNLYYCFGCGTSIIIGTHGCQTIAYSENGILVRKAFCGSFPCTKIYRQCLQELKQK